MNCSLFEEMMIDRLAGELSSADAAHLDRHLEECAACRETWKELSQTWELVRLTSRENLRKSADTLDESRLRAIQQELHGSGSAAPEKNAAPPGSSPFSQKSFLLRVAALFLIGLLISFLTYHYHLETEQEWIQKFPASLPAAHKTAQVEKAPLPAEITEVKMLAAPPEKDAAPPGKTPEEPPAAAIAAANTDAIPSAPGEAPHVWNTPAAGRKKIRVTAPPVKKERTGKQAEKRFASTDTEMRNSPGQQKKIAAADTSSGAVAEGNMIPVQRLLAQQYAMPSGANLESAHEYASAPPPDQRKNDAPAKSTVPASRAHVRVFMVRSPFAPDRYLIALTSAAANPDAASTSNPAEKNAPRDAVFLTAPVFSLADSTAQFPALIRKHFEKNGRPLPFPLDGFRFLPDFDAAPGALRLACVLDALSNPDSIRTPATLRRILETLSSLLKEKDFRDDPAIRALFDTLKKLETL